MQIKLTEENLKLPKTIIFIVPRNIYPIEAGPIKLAFNHARNLKAIGYKTILINTWFGSNLSLIEEKELRSAFDEIHIVNIKIISIFKSILLSIKERIINGLPLQTVLLSQNSIIKKTEYKLKRILNLQNKNNIHIIFFTIRSYPLWQIAKALRVKYSINLIDSVSLNTREKLKNMIGLKRLFWSCELKALNNFEKNLPANNFLNAYISVSDKDLKEFKIKSDNISTKTKLIKSTIGISNKSNDSTTKKNQIIFFGSLFYEPNISAAYWLIDNIMPEVWKNKPNLNLIIAGRRPNKKLINKLSKFKQITLIKNPLNMNKLISESIISIAPMISGSGQQFKIIEALSNQVPVVSTSKGSNPLGLINKKHLLVADSSEDFAKNIVQLMDDPILRNELALNGKEFVIENFTWLNITKKLVKDLFY